MKKLAIAFAISAVVSAPAFAQGQHQIGAGVLYMNPQEKSEPMVTRLADGRVINYPDSVASLENVATLGLTYTYHADDNVSIQVVGGIPPKLELSGSGESTVGDLSQFKNIATTRAYSPTVVGIYTFGDRAQKLRPYVGVGVSYSKFEDIKIDKGFDAAARGRGAGLVNMALAAANDPRAGHITADMFSTRAEADDSIDPVLVLGLDYKLNEKWSAQASISYIPLETSATVYIDGPTGEVANMTASMEVNPIVSYVGLAYRF